jgi:hypothetical protein
MKEVLMATKELKARMRNKRDTASNWATNNPMLLNGEVVIVDTSSGETRTKTGDGSSRYNALPFDDEIVRNLIGARVVISQGSANAGKIMAVGVDGNVAPAPYMTWGSLAGVSS